MKRRLRISVLDRKARGQLFVLAVAVPFMGGVLVDLRQDAPPAVVAAGTITVNNVVLGKTPTYLGATEGFAFYKEDLLDLGIDTYKLWTELNELEWWDDDDGMDGLWDDSEYGTPTIAQIKADAPNGFVNTVPWAWWEERFTEVQYWRFGVKTRIEMLDFFKANSITPIMLLRTYNTGALPERRPLAQWGLRPPVNQAFRNEWWEHCFAMAYWLNVLHDYRITHFQVLNEPNYYKCPLNGNPCRGQGWIGSYDIFYGGTKEEYVQLVADAKDAITFANDLAGLPAIIHAPVVSLYTSDYIPYSLDNADASIDVLDFHTFITSKTTVTTTKNLIAGHNPDGILEPIFVSEFGQPNEPSAYRTLKDALEIADYLMMFAAQGVDGATINNMYDWNPAAAAYNDLGLIDLQGDSVTVTNRVRTEGYYAYRLLLRALKGGKDRLNFASTGIVTGQAMILRDPANLYVLVRNAVGPVTVKIGSVPGYGGTATLYEYSASKKDEVVGTVPVVNNQFTFSAGDSSLTLAMIPTTLACGGKTITLVGTNGADFLTGTAVVDVIAGLGGNDVIEGLGGNDVICGGDGDDTLYGGDGADTLFGDAGADILKGGGAKDTLTGGPGDDTLDGEGGNDALDGGQDTDACNGGKGTGDTAGASCETVTGVP